MEKVKEVLRNEKVLSYIVIVAVAIIVCISLFSKYMSIAYDDGIQHICRLIGTYDAIKEGNSYPVIMSRFL